MSFAAYYPYLVHSIILLGPGGVLRALPEEYKNPFFRFRHFVPDSYLRRLVGNILGVDLSNTAVRKAALTTGKEIVTLDMATVAQWQFDHHEGFVYSFIDTIIHGPLMNQHADWKRVCNIIRGEPSGGAPRSHTSGLFNSKILVIFGDDDNIVVKEDVSADLSKMLGGPEHVEFRVTSGGHGFPVPSADDIVKHICQFLNL